MSQLSDLKVLLEINKVEVNVSFFFNLANYRQWSKN